MQHLRKTGGWGILPILELLFRGHGTRFKNHASPTCPDPVGLTSHAKLS